MRTLKLTIAYDGTDYCGWQSQRTGTAIQDFFESAWHRVTREHRRVIASGRTDAGVHALGQVVSLWTETHHSTAVLTRALNANLPEDIRILETAEAARSFNALRDATGKCYRYRIQDGGARDVFSRRFTAYRPQPLDELAMQTAAKQLVGEHDFRAFQTSGSPRKSTVRHVRRLDVRREPGDLSSQVVIEIEANGFLYNMVRNIAGTLIDVGRHKYDAPRVAEILASRDRQLAGATAAPCGLCLVRVHYPSTMENGPAATPHE